MVDAIGAEQRWILHQAVSASDGTVPNHQCDTDPWRRHDQRKAVLYIRDTTAQPNVVYYYQIEDVSLDGNRQTLTRGIRLKGYVGAAGKATVLWGELKRTN